MSSQYLDPHQIAASGVDIYDRKYRTEFEQRHNGEFAAIDINSEAVYLANLPENALSKARDGSPEGIFYLLRVGSSGAFKSTGMTQGVSNAIEPRGERARDNGFPA
jgi:hypothetical protein